MPDVLIFGAGSIGNHLAYAASQKKWNVSITDKDIKKSDKGINNEIKPNDWNKISET